ncbi:hypothetical protein AB204_01305 [Xenorhabdus khoisanae]|uniref:Uncharacterized protein n=1 Tax=Xenorhabdus khoisanae TaxID=880157 RepID=A0A0J5FXB2_9GAMM|nr:hypothetical protein AB204_01305 [Xenorhabdus khoisanae]
MYTLRFSNCGSIEYNLKLIECILIIIKKLTHLMHSIVELVLIHAIRVIAGLNNLLAVGLAINFVHQNNYWLNTKAT